MNITFQTKLGSWLQLVRIANWPSALSNVLAAFLLANGAWAVGEGATSLLPLVSLSAISLALFAAGMILNDWHDYPRDQRERPERPLARGVIDRRHALGVVITLFVAAFAGGAVLSWSVGNWRTVAVALGIIASILAYDVWFKETAHAALWMGLCRGGNVLLGASTASIGTASGNIFFSPEVWAYALCLTTYIAGITWMAKNEVDERAGVFFWTGLVTSLVAIGGFACLPFVINGLETVWRKEQVGYSLLAVVVGFSIFRRAAFLFIRSSSTGKFGVIIFALRSIILLDAAICLMAGQGSMIFALAVVCLLPLSFGLARYNRLS
ncbi:MAG: UbiA family prenyltransferase [Pirellulaceae bacterium]